MVLRVRNYPVNFFSLVSNLCSENGDNFGIDPRLVNILKL